MDLLLVFALFALGGCVSMVHPVTLGINHAITVTIVVGIIAAMVVLSLTG